MPTYVNEGERFERFLIPAGTYQAVCYDIWDIGYHPTTWNGVEKYQPKVILAWEITEVHQSGELQGKRMTLSKRYTKSIAEQARLRKELESWRGKSFTAEELKNFDLDKLIGVNCMLSIVHNEKMGKTYANIGGISALMRGMMPLKPENQRGIPKWVSRLKDQSRLPDTENLPDHPVDSDESPIPF